MKHYAYTCLNCIYKSFEKTRFCKDSKWSCEVKIMGYTVYMNHPNNKAIIHSTSCGKFEKRRRDETLNGYWSIVEQEPFETIKDARDYAVRTGKRNIDTCAFCIK